MAMTGKMLRANMKVSIVDLGQTLDEYDRESKRVARDDIKRTLERPAVEFAS
jgi:hypothetical protein